MNKIYFTVGPTKIFPAVPAALEKAKKDDILSISHRSKEFSVIYEELRENLFSLLSLENNWYMFFVGSATEAMERIIQNTVDLYSYHLVNGSFSERFFQIAKSLGIKAEKCEKGYGDGFDIDDCVIPEKAELVCLTHNETSTGVKFTKEFIEQFREKNRNILIAVDVVSSAPCIDANLNLFDIFFFSVQKCFGLPSGMGVLFVNERAIEKSVKLAEKGEYTGGFHSFTEMKRYAQKKQTPETPNVLSIFLLGIVAREMLIKGKNEILQITRTKAERLYQFFERDTRFSPFVQEGKYRSDTIIVADTIWKTDEIMKTLSENGIVINRGYRGLDREQVRIANFPAHTMEDISRLIEVLEKL